MKLTCLFLSAFVVLFGSFSSAFGSQVCSVFDQNKAVFVDLDLDHDFDKTDVKVFMGSYGVYKIRATFWGPNADTAIIDANDGKSRITTDGKSLVISDSQGDLLRVKCHN